MIELVRIDTQALANLNALDKVTVARVRPKMLIALDIHTPVWVTHFPEMKQQLSDGQARYRFLYSKADVELASLVSLSFGFSEKSENRNVTEWYDPAREFSVLWTPYTD